MLFNKFYISSYIFLRNIFSNIFSYVRHFFRFIILYYIFNCINWN